MSSVLVSALQANEPPPPAVDVTLTDALPRAEGEPGADLWLHVRHREGS